MRLQPSGAAVPSCLFKNVLPSPSFPSCDGEGDVLGEKRWLRAAAAAAGIRIAGFCCETGTDVCRQAGLQADTEKNTSESCERLCLQGWGEGSLLGWEKGTFCVGLSRGPRTSILVLGVGMDGALWTEEGGTRCWKVQQDLNALFPA